MANTALRPLIITDEHRARALEIQEYAFLHRQTWATLREQKSTNQRLQEPERHMLSIPTGYKVAYTIEQREPAIGWCHNVSVVMDVPKMMPTPAAVCQILALFGIVPPAKAPVAGKPGAGALASAVRVEEQKISESHTAISVLYKFDFATWLADHPQATP